MTSVPNRSLRQIHITSQLPENNRQTTAKPDGITLHTVPYPSARTGHSIRICMPIYLCPYLSPRHCQLLLFLQAWHLTCPAHDITLCRHPPSRQSTTERTTFLHIISKRPFHAKRLFWTDSRGKSLEHFVTGYTRVKRKWKKDLSFRLMNPVSNGTCIAHKNFVRRSRNSCLSTDARKPGKMRGLPLPLPWRNPPTDGFDLFCRHSSLTIAN